MALLAGAGLAGLVLGAVLAAILGFRAQRREAGRMAVVPGDA
jgi:hypothetical protein